MLLDRGNVASNPAHLRNTISFLRWFAFAGLCVALSWCREVAGVCAGSIPLPFEMRRRYELFSP
jgi:hypothetical protein